ncbi:MAG: sulfotransferase [Acidimicrobiales bacterium]|jgi:hypothetical protein
MSGESIRVEDHQMVFVGGLHRSGTSLLARMLASHPEASGLTGTGVPEDEGQHVQHSYDTARQHGGPGRFAFDPLMHLTEAEAAAHPEAAGALFQAWSPYWDLSRRVLVEKSPPNLIKSRYLQMLFPNAYFVMTMRHPISVAGATAKWSKTSRRALIAHWVAAHEIMAGDLPHLRRVRVLRYEDVVTDPVGEHARLLRWLGLDLAETSETVRSGVNEKYYRAWEAGSPWAKRSGRMAERDFADRVDRFGYSLVPPYVPNGLPPEFAERMNSPVPPE